MRTNQKRLRRWLRCDARCRVTDLLKGFVVAGCLCSLKASKTSRASVIIQSFDFTATHGLEVIYNTIEPKRCPNLMRSRESWEASQAPRVPWKQQNWKLKEEFLLHNGSARPRFRGSAPDSGSARSSVCFGLPRAPGGFAHIKSCFP